jgi:hypothetical protein
MGMLLLQFPQRDTCTKGTYFLEHLPADEKYNIKIAMKSMAINYTQKITQITKMHFPLKITNSHKAWTRKGNII